MNASDNRKHTRIEFKVAVDVETDSMLQRFHAKNLSRGGIFLEVPGKAPKLGSKLKIKFTVPGLNKVVTIEGTVKYVHKFESFEDEDSESKNGIGIQSEDMSKKDEQIIAEYILGKHVSLR